MAVKMKSFCLCDETFIEGKKENVYDIYGCQEIYHIRIMAANIWRSGTGSLI